MTTPPAIRPILGTMTFGSDAQVTADAAGVFLRTFVGASCTKSVDGAMLDTARINQQATPSGDSESVLGDIFASYPSMEKRTSVATKASPLLGPHFSLSRCSVIEQCDTSLDKLGLDCLDLFYLQCPDVHTDIEDTLAGVEHLHKEGKITELGLSNYPAWAVVDIWHRCKNRGMVLPTVYQGTYNVISRDLEREIIPVVRQFGMRLYVYSPLAGGVLSGRYHSINELDSATVGRFSVQFDRAPGWPGDGAYRTRYAKEQIFNSVDILRRACAPAPVEGDVDTSGDVDEIRMVDGYRVHLQITETREQAKGLDMAVIALRWLIHHSQLIQGDGIIFGVSNNGQLAANLGAWLAGPLSAELCTACESAWEEARPVCASYFQGYGSQPGGVEKFLDHKRSLQNSNESSSIATPA